MPIVIGMFFLLPLLLGLVLEYLCCRLPRRRIWRALPLFWGSFSPFWWGWAGGTCGNRRRSLR